MTGERVLTPDVMYRAAFVVALLDVVVVLALSRFIGAKGLRGATWMVALVSGVFWFAVWGVMCTVFWAPVYSHVFPGWARAMIPPVYGLGFAAVASAWRWLGLRAGRHAVPVFCALWGATGALTHAWAVYGLGLLLKTPMLVHLTPASAIVFSFFEFTFYGCVILTVSARLHALLARRDHEGG